MYLQIGIISAVMVIAYAVAKSRKLSVEISMLSAAVAGGVAGAFIHTPSPGQLARHLVEGSFTYLDVILVFSTATIFMAIVSESGGVNYVVRATERSQERAAFPCSWSEHRSHWRSGISGSKKDERRPFSLSLPG